MMKTTIQTLGEVLNSVDGFPWNRAVYVAGNYPWAASTIAAVLDPAEVEDVKDKPKLVKQYGLQYALDIETAQDVVHGAKKQIPEPDTQFLVDSFNYYWKYDAFLRLT